MLDEDAGFIMPVPINYTFGMPRILQPPYCQQLGIFGTETPTPSVCKAFIEHHALRVLHLHIAFNMANKFPENTKGLFYKPDSILLLNKPYNQLRALFNENTIRNIRKASKAGLYVKQENVPEALLRIKWESRPAGMKKKHLMLAGEIMQNALKRGTGEIWYAYARNKEPVAGCFFLNDDLRSVYLISASSPEGKATGAMFLLVDRFVETYAGSGRMLDFEGSVIPGIDRFFKGFGAETSWYPVINRFLFGVLPYGKK